MSNPPTNLDAVRKVMDGLPPFTITVKTSDELLFLFNALLFQAANCNAETARALGDFVGAAFRELGPERGMVEVKDFLEAVKHTRPIPIPPWFYPMIVHIYTHVKTKEGNNDK